MMNWLALRRGSAKSGNAFLVFLTILERDWKQTLSFAIRISADMVDVNKRIKCCRLLENSDVKPMNGLTKMTKEEIIRCCE